MEMVKNNIVSIIFGVIALVALTTPLWLIGGYQESLQSEADKRKAVGTALDGLAKKSRTKPAPTPEGQPQPLGQFPNQKTIEAGEALRDRVARTATDMVADAVRMNRREPLVPDSLPRPRNNAEFRFRDEYNARAKTTRIVQDRLRGGTPPTTEQIAAEVERVGREFEQRKFRGAQGQSNEAQLQQEFQAESAKIPLRMTVERAEQIKMYVEPNALTWHPAIQQGGPAPTPDQIWFAQLGLWIQENVADAIAATNAQAKDVRDATVKHLVRIEFAEKPYVNAAAAGAAGGASGMGMPSGMPPGMPSEYMQYGPNGPMGPMGGGGAAAAPTESVPTAMPDASQPLPKQYEQSITGRVSNALFDVVHFKLVVITDATRLPVFLQELGRERFMYVRGMQVTSVDPSAQQLAGYIYGDDPVVQVSLDMEMLFMRGWTMPLMPDPIRISLGIPPASAVPPPGATP